MSEAAAGGGRRAEIERTLVQRSLEDESFRQRLLDDPKGTIEQELGSGLPESIEVGVVEESAETLYLVLPSASSWVSSGERTSLIGYGSRPQKTGRRVRRCAVWRAPTPPGWVKAGKQSSRTHRSRRDPMRR
jgi:hypothetical protein